MDERKANGLCGLAGFGFYMPAKKVAVYELAQKAGIPRIVADFAGARTVREAEEGVLPSKMAIEAAREALKNAETLPEELDLIIYCGAGLPDYVIPQTSGHIQHALGARNAFAFDLGQGCSGMLSALQTAKGYISLEEGIETVLLVSGDKWSKFTRFHAADSVFFGDGGGAVVVSKKARDFRPLCFNVITDGTYYALWRIEMGGISHPPSPESMAKGYQYYDCWDKPRAHGEFKEIYVPTIIRGIKGALKKCGLRTDDVSYLDMVNANLKVLEIVADALSIPMTRTSAKYLIEYGHFGAHDVFLNLEMARREGRLKKGDIVVLQSTGIGFTWACAVLQY